MSEATPPTRQNKVNKNKTSTPPVGFAFYLPLIRTLYIHILLQQIICCTAGILYPNKMSGHLYNVAKHK